MRRIKIDQEQLDAFKKNSSLGMGLEALVRQWVDQNGKLFEGLKNYYPGLNFDNASVDHLSGELVLPFEKPEVS